MGGFLKRLFKSKNDTKDVTHEDEIEVVNMVSDEIMAEENIAGSETPGNTNKLPAVPDETAAGVFKNFSCYQFYSASNPGMVRKNNQDSVFTAAFNYNTESKPISAGIAIVADGMGGLSMGEIASKTAVASVGTYMNARLCEYVESGIPHGQVIFGHINDAVLNANGLVCTKGEELGQRIGTTLTFVLLLGNVAYLGHVGDSRAYLINTESKSIEKVTRDHSLVGRLIEMGQLTEKDAKSHPRRNEIYRMLGLRNELEVDTYYRIIDKNSIIVLMSDGLWEFVDDDELLHEILSGSLPESAGKLIDMANKNGGHDNISVAIIKPIE